MKTVSSLSFTDQRELVSRAQQDDHQAFTELMQRTSGASLGIATAMLKNHHLAEEEVQNAYFNAWQHLRQFQGEALFSTWMSRIVVNQCLMHLRGLRRSRQVSMGGQTDSEGRLHSLELADQGPNAETRVCNQSQSVDLSRHIGKLPTKLRRAVILRDMKEMSTVEAAKTLGITVAALKSRLLRARIELRSRMSAGLSGPTRQSQPVVG